MVYFAIGPSIGPQDVGVMIVTSTTATVTWRGPPCKMQNGAIKEYVMMVESSSGHTRSMYTPAKQRYQDLILHVIEHLTPSTKYTFTVAAINKAGTSNFSTVQFTTKKGKIFAEFHCIGVKMTILQTPCVSMCNTMSGCSGVSRNGDRGVLMTTPTN